VVSCSALCGHCGLWGAKRAARAGTAAVTVMPPAARVAFSRCVPLDPQWEAHDLSSRLSRERTVIPLVTEPTAEAPTEPLRRYQS